MASIDTTAAIRELQTYLRTISRFQGKMPLLQATGTYDDLTRKAVMEFQQEHNLPVTGAVDLTTWEAIASAYQKTIFRNSIPIPLDLFPSSSFLLGKGASGELVQGVQLVLRALAQKFHNLPMAPNSGVFEGETEQAVQEIQRKTQLEPTGVIDLATWNHIAWLYNFTSKEVFDGKVHES